MLQYPVLGYKIYLYFFESKLAIEVDEKGHTNRDKRKEKTIKNKKELNCKFIRINPEEKTLIFMLKLVRYTITLLNQLKTNRQDSTNTIKIQVKKKLRLIKRIVTCVLPSI